MNGLPVKQSSFWRFPESELQESPSILASQNNSMPEMAITLDFNVKNGPVVKTTPLIKEPESVERNFELRKCSSHVFANPEFFKCLY